MTFDYSLFKNKTFIGTLAIDEKMVVKVANTIGATSYTNENNQVTYIKCSNCGEWEQKNYSEKVLCSQCAYNQRIQDFIDYMENSLYHAWDDEDKGSNELAQKLYNEKIRISFNGASLELDIAPCEWDYILNCLKNIKEDNPW